MSSTRARPRKLYNRKKVTKNSFPVAASLVATVSLVAGKMRLTFSSPVVLNGVPTQIIANALACNSASAVSATVIDCGFAVNPVATNPWTIPATVTAIKSSTGGVPAAASGTF